MSPSPIVWAGEMARASPSWAMIAIRFACALVSLALVATTPIVVFSPLRTAGAEPGALVTANPHSQVFGVAVQLGIAGAALLIAMWLAHLALFTANTPMAWFGLIVVAQNIIGSLLNSHISDFTQGWIYVLGVGVLGGALRPRSSGPPST